MSKYLSGKNSVLEGLQNEMPIKAVYLLKGNTIEVNKDIEIFYLNKDQMNKMVDSRHQGYIAELKEFPFYNIESIFKDMPKRVLVLDHIQDPHNFGAILRTANAAGINHIIIPKNRTVGVTPTVLKVSSGGFVGMKIIRVDSLQATVKKLKDKMFWIYATSLDDTSVDIKYVDFNDPAVIIMGSEKSGVSKTLLKQADQVIHIDMHGTVQSLNVSVATGIILFK